MRNVGILLLLALATIAVWGISSAFLVGPLLHVGESSPLYLHIATVPDIVGLAAYAAWAFIVAWLSCRWLSGWAYRGVAFAFVLLFFLFVRGVFITSNLRSAFVMREFVLAAIVTVVIFLGVLAATSNPYEGSQVR